MPFVYTCIYSSSDNCLFFAKKKRRGMFFEGRYVGGTNGVVLNYSGQHVLPGGRTNIKSPADKEAIATEALREFKEETGYGSGFGSLSKEIKSFSNEGGILTSGDAAFHCLYIKMTAEQINDLKDTITAFINKSNVQRFEMGMDDELEKVTVKEIAHAKERLVTFVDGWADPEYGSRIKDKTWFGHIVDNRPA